MSVRPAQPSDVDDLHRMVVELATYEEAADQVRTTPDQLRRALFGPDPAVFCQVAEHEGRVVGMALWFLTFSTWEGVHGIYLEDVYVQPGHRGAGLGRALLATLAGIAVERGYARLDWAVLDWNAPSIAFYRGIGAVAMDGWTGYRLTGPALTALSQRAEPAPLEPAPPH